VSKYNRRHCRVLIVVDGINELFAARKREVARGDANALAGEVRRLEAVANRSTSQVIDMAQGYVDVNTEYTQTTSVRTVLRQQHDRAMVELLGRYQVRINARLGQFRAGFTIDDLGGKSRRRAGAACNIRDRASRGSHSPT
jgi:hypothetical protein